MRELRVESGMLHRSLCKGITPGPGESVVRTVYHPCVRDEERRKDQYRLLTYMEFKIGLVMKETFEGDRGVQELFTRKRHWGDVSLFVCPYNN